MPAHPLPLKTLHIISGDLWAGAEVQALTLLSALHEMDGVEVAVAVLNDGELADRLRAKNIPVSLFNEQHLSSLQIWLGLRKLMLQWRPDIVHTHRIKENVLGSVANFLAGNAACLRTAHGATEHKPHGLRQIAKKISIKIDHLCGNYLQQRIVAVSNDLAIKLGADFYPAKIVVIENGVDIDSVKANVHPIDFKLQEPSTNHIGIVGRLVPVKRVDIFLQMAAQLRSNQPHKAWRFHIFGDGPLRDELMAQAQQLGIGSACVFHGHRSDIIACIAALNTLVMCSDHEGLPMTILEAIVLGTPIVAHAVGGLNDVLKGISQATLVTVHTANDYATSVENTLRKMEFGNCQPETPATISAATNATRMLNLYRVIQR